MAVQGAHLTSTALEEGDSPSIFEVLAQESLVQALRPAIQHLFRLLAENNPTRYGKLYACNEEVYLGLQLLLENYYLNHYSSSFSENFYGMKRVAINPGTENSIQIDHEATVDESHDQSDTDTQTTDSDTFHRLPRSNRLKSLLFLVLVPYIKSKCDQWYETLKEATYQQEAQQSTTQQKWKKHLCRAFLGIYPILHLVWETTMLGCQMAYVFDKAQYHSPFLKWAGVILQNLSEEDMTRQGKTKPLDLADKSWRESVLLIASKILGGIAVTLSSGLSVGVFFLQFLEWWYASDQHSTKMTALPNPPPPKPSVSTSVPRLHTLCPLCQKVRTNDTALAVSGYVFCYGCISQYISDNHQCPVNRYPATTDHLIRLYLPDR